jgi:hypothetical protein
MKIAEFTSRDANISNVDISVNHPGYPVFRMKGLPDLIGDINQFRGGSFLVK